MTVKGFFVCLKISLFEMDNTSLSLASLSLRHHAHGPLDKRLMHMVKLFVSTSVVSKSSDWLNYTGIPGDVCVAFFNILPENKDAVAPNPSRKKKAVVFLNVTANAYQVQLNAGFSKVCEIFKVCGIESLKYIREFHTPVCYCGNNTTHRNVTLNVNVIGCLTCRSNGLMGGPWPMNEAIDLQPSVWLRESLVTGWLE